MNRTSSSEQPAAGHGGVDTDPGRSGTPRVENTGASGENRGLSPSSNAPSGEAGETKAPSDDRGSSQAGIEQSPVHGTVKLPQGPPREGENESEITADASQDKEIEDYYREQERRELKQKLEEHLRRFRRVKNAWFISYLLFFQLSVILNAAAAFILKLEEARNENYSADLPVFLAVAASLSAVAAAMEFSWKRLNPHRFLLITSAILSVVAAFSLKLAALVNTLERRDLPAGLLFAAAVFSILHLTVGYRRRWVKHRRNIIAVESLLVDFTEQNSNLKTIREKLKMVIEKQYLDNPSGGPPAS